jgi:membrane protein implicated in regulation of membrane protease activity
MKVKDEYGAEQGLCFTLMIAFTVSLTLSLAAGLNWLWVVGFFIWMVVALYRLGDRMQKDREKEKVDGKVL